MILCEEKQHYAVSRRTLQSCSCPPSSRARSRLGLRFDDVLVYLKSIKAYFAADDDFLWNFGLALASTGESA